MNPFVYCLSSSHSTTTTTMSTINLVSPASSALDLAPQSDGAGPSRHRPGSPSIERPRHRLRAMSEERSLGDRRTFVAAHRGGGNRTYAGSDDAGSDNEIVFTGEHLAPSRQTNALAREGGEPILQRPTERRINDVLHGELESDGLTDKCRPRCKAESLSISYDKHPQR